MKGKIFIADVLRREMKNRQLSLTDLGLETGIPKSTLHGWANGTIPSARHLHLVLKLSEFLNIPIGELLFNTRDEKKENIVIFSSEFSDGRAHYRFIVEKCNK